jgi:hypothetical protein
MKIVRMLSSRKPRFTKGHNATVDQYLGYTASNGRMSDELERI